MKIIIMIFFVIFVIWYIAVSVYDIIYSFRKKKTDEKEIIIDLTEIMKQSFREHNKKKAKLRKERRKCRYYKNYINKK